MKNRFIIFGLVLSTLSIQTYAEVKVKNLNTLDDCFRAAIHQSELVADQSELIGQAEERYKQAMGSLYPTLSGTASYQVQESVGSNIFPATQPLLKISATQPLFQGFREYAGLRQTRDLIQVQQDTRWQILVQLYQDTAQEFYTLLSLEKEQKNIENQLGLYEKRTSDLNQLVKIGRSRPSEVLAVRTEMEKLKAQQNQIKTQILVHQDVFQFLTGLSPGTPLADQDSAPFTLPELGAYLNEVPQRPDVKSALAAAKASEEGIRIAQGGHLPSVNLLGNYYFLRAGLLQNSSWDAQIALTLPIFSGGVIQSNVRFAESQKQQKDLNLARAQRLATQDISTKYHTLQGDIFQVQDYIRITHLAELNYNTQVQDYRHRLVNNIDVLQALTAFQESTRSLDRAKYSAKLDYAKLEAAVAHRATQEKLSF